MKTAVVILNWNGEKFLREFLGGILASLQGHDAQLIVADNGSADGSLAYMAESFPSVKTIELDKNYGFTGGYNRAIAQVDAEYVVLLNSDIEVDPHWLGPLVAHMDAHPECAGCQPKMLQFTARDTFEYAGAAGGLLDKYGFPYCRGRIRKKVEKDNGQYDTPEKIFWASGAALTVRKSVWDLLGGLDEQFFAHMEEIDWCWRAQLAGYEIHYVPESKVYHLGGGTLAPESPFKLYLNFRNNAAMLRKNLPATIGRRKAAWRIGVRTTLDALIATVYLLSGETDKFKAVRKAYKDLEKMNLEVVKEGKPLARGIENKKILL